jgi:hypothetical protein
MQAVKQFLRTGDTELLAVCIKLLDGIARTLKCRPALAPPRQCVLVGTSRC